MKGTQQSSRRLIFWLAILAILAGIILHSCRKDIVVLTAKSPTGESASIVAYREINLMEYSADLILYSRDGRAVYRASLLQARDAVEDVSAEFPSLKFEGEAVRIESTGLHYHGTNVFIFPQ